jgi:hypothetical protein
MKMHSYIRIPTNHSRDCWTCLSVAENDLKNQIDYDKKSRWGQSIFVDGKCVHVGKMSGHAPKIIKKLEADILKFNSTI